MDNPTFNVLSLCSGVGGLDLAIRIAVPNSRTIGHVEIEAYATRILAARMSDGWLDPAPIWMGDIADFDPTPFIGLVDCVISGDPCQPNSVAGSGKGADDDRFLIDQVLRIVRVLRPYRFFRENVPGNAHGQLAALVPALERMGYIVAAGIFSAREVGASHLRERLFVMADCDLPGPTRLGTIGGTVSAGTSRLRHGLDAGSARTAEELVDAAGERDGGLHPGQGRPYEAAFEPHRGSEGVADAGHGQLSMPGRGSEGRDGFRPAGEALADAAGPRSPPRGFGARGTLRHGTRRPGSHGRSDVMDDAERGRRAPWRDGPDQGGQGRGIGNAAGAGCTVADASGTGLPLTEFGGESGAPEQGQGARATTDEFHRGRNARPALPIFAPGPADPRWPEIIDYAPYLKPAIRRMAIGMAEELHEVISEAEQHTKKSKQTYFLAWKKLCEMRLETLTATSSSRLQQAAQGDIFVRETSRSSASSAEAESEMRGLQEAIQAEAVEQRYSMWLEEVSQRAWALINNQKMGWQPTGETVRLVRDGVQVYEASYSDMLPILREQVSLGKAENRIDRLRSTGNGVVPLSGAIAWRSLEARIAEAKDDAVLKRKK